MPVDWKDIHKKLSAEFPEAEVKQKKQATSKDGQHVLMVAYIDARSVMNRLDSVVGPENWSYDWVLQVDGSVKGVLTIHGVTKCDRGEVESPEEATAMKGAVSDALKRAGVLFGIGRYLYERDKRWVDATEADKPKPAQVQPFTSATESHFWAFCKARSLDTQKIVCEALSIPAEPGSFKKNWIGRGLTYEEAEAHIEAVLSIVKEQEVTITEANVKLAMGAEKKE
uniref:Putative Rad52/22 double-strand break repair protein n=1 Tax=viral metagenome TaxID=1070528 RepID=A0A6H1ZGX2_9ZZZZ